jgi:hypothetical protein
MRRGSRALRRNHTSIEFEAFNSSRRIIAINRDIRATFAAEARDKSCRDVTPAIVRLV